MEPGACRVGGRVMTDAWLRIVLFALVLASFGGCERPSVGEGTTPGTGPASDEWMGFRQYPGARHLCSGSASAFSNGRPAGLSWSSFASREAPAKVAAFYGATATADRDFTVNQPGGRSLSVHPSAATYPSCAEQPRSGEATVIVIAVCAGCER